MFGCYIISHFDTVTKFDVYSKFTILHKQINFILKIMLKIKKFSFKSFCFAVGYLSYNYNKKICLVYEFISI